LKFISFISDEKIKIKKKIKKIKKNFLFISRLIFFKNNRYKKKRLKIDENRSGKNGPVIIKKGNKIKKNTKV
tara:strand:+ start:406 stop:621 length:216 start_codon:yes stop_codon:yes gene_type:complete